MLKLPRIASGLTSRLCYLCENKFSTSSSLTSQQPKENEKQLATTAANEVSEDDQNKDPQHWRTPWHEKEGQYFSLLRGMYTTDSNRGWLQFMQSEVDFSPSAIKAWYKKRKQEKEIILQSYIPERNEILGNELAAAHFVVYRGGAVKFHGEDKWIKADTLGNYAIPNKYDGTKILEAIDCENMTMYYEGFVNFRKLAKLQWLSLRGCEHIDDWCLDRVSNIFRDSLVYLDLRNCENYTHRGLGALYKMPHLRILYVDDLVRDSNFELTCLMLQEVNPKLDIRDDCVEE